MNYHKHIIDRVFLEVQTNSSKTAFELKDNVGVFLKEHVFPSIEDYFDTKSGPYSSTILRFNKIELELYDINIDNLIDTRDQILIHLKKKMDQIIQNNSASTSEKKMIVVNNEERDLDIFLFFLETGANPWWNTDIKELFKPKAIKFIISGIDFKPRFRKLLSQKVVQERLIHQFDDTTIGVLLSGLDSNSAKTKEYIFRIPKKDKWKRTNIWIDIIQKKVLRKKSSTKRNTPLLDPESKQNRGDEESIDIIASQEGIYFNNAGIILLHPFLQRLFVATNMADLKGNIIPDKRAMAVHLLHYISTKKEQQAENELVLEKFLCGYPLEKPIERSLILEKEMKQMAEELLLSTIDHWTALKNTSPDGLRTGFLQRKGKLMIENGKNRLIVERKTQDILLDRIPWNIHLIKLPWLDSLIYVDW